MRGLAAHDREAPPSTAPTAMFRERVTRLADGPGHLRTDSGEMLVRGIAMETGGGIGRDHRCRPLAVLGEEVLVHEEVHRGGDRRIGSTETDLPCGTDHHRQEIDRPSGTGHP